MMKLEKPQYKIVQYRDKFSGSWGLGFSLMDLDEENGWEYCPMEKRVAMRFDYKLSTNIEENDTIFTYGF